MLVLCWGVFACMFLLFLCVCVSIPPPKHPLASPFQEPPPPKAQVPQPSLHMGAPASAAANPCGAYPWDERIFRQCPSPLRVSKGWGSGTCCELGVFQRPLTLTLLQKYRDTTGSRCKLVVYILLSARGRFGSLE